MLLAYAQLTDHERLERALAGDDRYHAAKLTAMAFSDDRTPIWEEHEAFRASVLTMPEQQVSRDDLEAQLLRHFRPAPTGAN